MGSVAASGWALRLASAPVRPEGAAGVRYCVWSVRVSLIVTGGGTFGISGCGRGGGFCLACRFKATARARTQLRVRVRVRVVLRGGDLYPRG